MSDRKYLVYKHTNLINNKVYIGQTCQKAKIRWQYGGGYRHNLHFYAAIKLYGWNNFSHEIIAENLSKEQADELEKKLIKEFKSTDSNYGYNILFGGSDNTRYETEEEAVANKKRIQHEAYKRMISNVEYAEKMRQKSLTVYYNNKDNEQYMAARAKSNKINRKKVNDCRKRLKVLYDKDSSLFNEDEYKIAFGFKNSKNYICNSIKKLEELLNTVEEWYYEKRKSEN